MQSRRLTKAIRVTAYLARKLLGVGIHILVTLIFLQGSRRELVMHEQWGRELRAVVLCELRGIYICV